MSTSNTTNADFKFNGNDLFKLRAKLGLTQEECAAQIGISARSLMRYEKGEQTPSASNFRLISAWMASAADPGNAQPQAPNMTIADSNELRRLKADLDQERKEHEALQALYSEVVKHRNEMREVMEGLYLETQVLSKEIESLRLQASASSLTPADARLISEIADALGVPAKKGLRGVLQRVRANLASAGVLTGAEGKDGGEG